MPASRDTCAFFTSVLPEMTCSPRHFRDTSRRVASGSPPRPRARPMSAFDATPEVEANLAVLPFWPSVFTLWLLCFCLMKAYCFERLDDLAGIILLMLRMTEQQPSQYQEPERQPLPSQRYEERERNATTSGMRCIRMSRRSNEPLGTTSRASKKRRKAKAKSRVVRVDMVREVYDVHEARICQAEVVEVVEAGRVVEVEAKVVDAMMVEARGNLDTAEAEVMDRNELMAGDSEMEARLCVICWDAPKTHIMLPCGHKCVCQSCAADFSCTSKGCQSCPLCRNRVEKVTRVFE